MPLKKLSFYILQDLVFEGGGYIGVSVSIFLSVGLYEGQSRIKGTGFITSKLVNINQPNYYSMKYYLFPTNPPNIIQIGNETRSLHENYIYM